VAATCARTPITIHLEELKSVEPIKNIIAKAILLLFPITAFAGGQSGLGGYGTGIIVRNMTHEV